jgi:hypothetical protein
MNPAGPGLCAEAGLQETNMDEAANRYAQELMDAISAAIAGDAEVQACRARAKAAGFELNVAVEAQIRPVEAARTAPVVKSAAAAPQTRRLLPAAKSYEITAADRRFLRSLRIASEAESKE